MFLAISEVMYCEPFSLFVIVNNINIVTIFITMTRKILQIVLNDLDLYFLIRFLTYKLLIFNQYQFVKEVITTLDLLFSTISFTTILLNFAMTINITIAFLTQNQPK